MKLKYLLLCATLSVAFTSSAVLASENGKKPIPGKSDVMVADICLKPEIQSETDYKKTKELVRTEFEENLPVGSKIKEKDLGNDSNLLIVFYVQIMPDDFVMQLHRF
ncbi:hypothetical protein [Escherichia coli]|uniref:hypothetical protein n=1 Tax=Escherichia coli TaxID=562 RepID=UPI003B218D4C